MGIDVNKFQWRNCPANIWDQRIGLYVGEISMGSVWKAGSLESYGVSSSLPGTPQTDYYPTAKQAMWELEKQVYEWFRNVVNSS